MNQKPEYPKVYICINEHGNIGAVFNKADTAAQWCSRNPSYLYRIYNVYYRVDQAPR